MGHDHDHAHDGGTYYVEQLCTIGICGAIGVVTILLYTQGLLGLMLSRGLHWMVLAGGIGLLGLVAVRAVAVWFSVGKPATAHSHDHSHAHDHDHRPECAHDHDHHHA